MNTVQRGGSGSGSSSGSGSRSGPGFASWSWGGSGSGSWLKCPPTPWWACKSDNDGGKPVYTGGVERLALLCLNVPNARRPETPSTINWRTQFKPNTPRPTTAKSIANDHSTRSSTNTCSTSPGTWLGESGCIRCNRDCRQQAHWPRWQHWRQHNLIE